MTDISLDWCKAKDAADPLAAIRARFDLPEGVIYLDGNSLGPLPKGVRERLDDVITREWGHDLIKSWNTADWVNIPARVGAKIARLIGAEPDEVVMADSTSVNLFKVAAAACRLNPGRTEIISEPGNFPTDLYMMQGLTDFLGPDYKLTIVPRDRIVGAINANTAAVLLTHVHYVTGEMFDMAAVTAAARARGAMMIWDLSHSAGAVSVELDAANADFAVGCGYKYLNGGPGAPAFLYVASRHQAAVRQPLSGWFGHKAPFDFVDAFTPAPGIRRMLVGTPPVLGASALEAALDAFNGVDMTMVREKSVALSGLFLRLVAERITPFGIHSVSPDAAERRGSHVSLQADNGYAIIQALIDHGIVGDFRAPHFMRFGFTPLYLGYEDVYRAVVTLEDVLKSGIWRDEKYQARAAVT